MATEHIYTVSSHDDCDAGLDHCVAGSYRTLDRAVEECVNYIFERLDARHDLAWGMANDENHEDAGKFFGNDEDGYYCVNDEAGLRDYLRNELGSQRCYYVFDGNFTYRFDIDENDLVD